MITAATKSQLNTALAAQFGIIPGVTFTAWENSFLDDIRARFERFGDKLFVSEKQAAIIAKIAAKAH